MSSIWFVLRRDNFCKADTQKLNRSAVANVRSRSNRMRSQRPGPLRRRREQASGWSAIPFFAGKPTKKLPRSQPQQRIASTLPRYGSPACLAPDTSDSKAHRPHLYETTEPRRSRLPGGIQSSFQIDENRSQTTKRESQPPAVEPKQTGQQI